MIARTCNDVQSTDRCKGNGLLCANLVHWGQVTLHQVSRFRVAVSQTTTLWKLRPTLERQNGMDFPVEAQCGKSIPECAPGMGCAFPLEPSAEATSRNRRSNWDAVSGRQAKTKLRWNSSWLRLHPAKSGTIPPQLKLTNGSQGARQCCATTGERSPLA